MAMLSHDVLDRILGQRVAWDDVDIERDVERRQLLCAAALVCRSWSACAVAQLASTVLVRRLDDFAAIDRAEQAGSLSLADVRTVVVDDTDCRELDGLEAAWRAFETENGGPVDRTAQEMINAMGGHMEQPVAETIRIFSLKALELIRRLPQLREVRSTGSRVFSRVEGVWPISRLAIATLHWEQDYAEESADDALWATMQGWDALVALTIRRIDVVDDQGRGLPAIPVALSARLCELRMGVHSAGVRPLPAGRDFVFGRPADDGLVLQHSLFAGSTPHLRLLDVRLAGRLRVDEDSDMHDSQDDDPDWPARIFGTTPGAGDLCAFDRLVVGWTRRTVEAYGVARLLAALPASVRRLGLVVRPSHEE